MKTNTSPLVQALKVSPEGTPFSVVAILRMKQKRATRNGKAFLAVEFGDRFGASIWSDSKVYGTIERIEPGAIVSINGQIDFYNGNLSPKIEAVSVIPESQAGEFTERLTETSLVDSGEMAAEFARLVNSIGDPQIKKLVSSVFNEVGRSAFFGMPAARSMHHAWRGGLLEHTLTMIKLADAALPLYPHVAIDRNIVVAGIALHDLCKVGEYMNGLACLPTVRGRLIGHVAMTYGLLVKHGAAIGVEQGTIDALGHIVLSHHGQKEFGAPVVPCTAEAVLVSMIDLLDSRMGAVQAALRADPDREVTAYSRALQTELVAKCGAMPVPAPAGGC